MRIAYLSGPADAVRIHQEWSAKTQAYFGTDYMKQFIQLATDLDAESYVITWYGDEAGEKRLGSFLFDNRPLTKASGLLYYLAHLWWHLKLIPKLLRFRPDVLILTGNMNFWWTLALVPTEFLPSYHSVLWPKFGPVRRSWQVLLQIERWLILRRCEAIVVTSGDIARQAAALSSAEIIHHLPSYSPRQFQDIPPPQPGRPFRVIYMGRIEADKGVFDILEIARRLEATGRYQFDICGSGSQLDRVRADAPGNVTCHGFCDQPKLQHLLGLSHVSIVPTRREFEAGFEMTCAEAILAGRPLITSAVCPALEYLRPAAIEVEPDNVDQYLRAIVELSENPELYEAKRAACAPLQAQFYDPSQSWYAAMRRALDKLGLLAAAPTRPGQVDRAPFDPALLPEPPATISERNERTQ